MSTITIIGGGLGTPQSLTLEAQDAISNAGRIYATNRLAEAFRVLNPSITDASYNEIGGKIASSDEDAAVIVSGDTGFFSLASGLKKQFGETRSIRMLPGISSMQALCARLRTGYEDVKAISSHGRGTLVLGPVSYYNRVLILTGGGEDAAVILHSLCEAGLEDVQVYAGQDLGSLKERVSSGMAAQLRDTAFSGLVVLLVENHRAAQWHTRLRDSDFIRGEVPMTKEPVRALAVDRLEVRPGDVVYDIGAGTGSVSVALARRAREGVVYAVEREEEGLTLIGKNAHRLGSHNVVAVKGFAPDCMEALPPPDRVFVGGSGGKLAEIVDACIGKGKPFVLCTTAITLESISEGVRVLEERGFGEVEAECISSSVSRRAGRYHMMTARNPVYLISGRWMPFNG